MSGLACECKCPGCDAQLIAKKGAIKKWHFAHYQVAGTQSCIESAIHAAAKQVLLDANWLRVPQKIIVSSCRTKAGHVLTKQLVLAPARTVRFDRSCEEVWETNIRPDVVGYRGERRIFVEMYFTHQVDEIKKHKLEALALPAIEIDLSKIDQYAGFDTVRTIVLHGVTEKIWLYYPGEKEAATALQCELHQELVQIDKEWEKEIVAQRVKHAAYQAAIDLKLNAIEDANARYRALSLDQKELIIRDALGLSERWPHHLNKQSPEATAIAAPPRLWQSALFFRFVFKKKELASPLHADTIAEWVTSRFGINHNRVNDTQVAVKKYLGYLRACGFLEKSSYNPYDRDFYIVNHDALAPPVKVKTISLVTVPISDCNPHQLATVSPISVSQSGHVPYWVWRASLPHPKQLLTGARALLSISTHMDILLREIISLTPRERPKDPFSFAMQMDAKNIPIDFTLDVLIRLQLAVACQRPSTDVKT